jgi:hypothetical protein
VARDDEGWEKSVQMSKLRTREVKMNGRASKKIRKMVEANVHANVKATATGLIHSLTLMPWRKRLKFSYCIIFKRPYK